MSAAAQVIVAVGVLILLMAIAAVVVKYARHIRISIGKVEAEMKPNGGQSLRDRIDALSAAVDGHFSELFAKVDNHEQRITALEKPKPKPRTPRKKAA